MSINKKGKQKLFTKFDGTNVPEDFEFPSIEIEDIDRTVFNFFDKELSFETESDGKTRKVPVVFATGERFALTRRDNPIRDKNNALILPIISIIRQDIDISIQQHGLGTPISYADQPGYYVKKRLASHDRQYQNIINKLGLKNQKNVASRNNFLNNDVSPGNIAKNETTTSRRNTKGLSFFSNGDGISLKENLGKNIFEIIETPYPQFVAIKYEAIFWSQYMNQANQILQTVFNSFEGQRHEKLLKTDNGYEMLMMFDKSFALDNNFDNFTDDERLIKHSVGLVVGGYIINPKNAKGIPNTLRSYYSAPEIDFGYKEANTNVVFKNERENKDTNLNKNILSDLNNINSFKETKRGNTSEDLEYFVENPFTGEKETKYSKVLSSNKRKGEAVISKLIVNHIERQKE